MPELPDIYISLGGVNFRSRAIRCSDWSDLLKSPPKRGSNRVIAGEEGRLPRTRVPDELRAGLQFRIQGRWNHPAGTAHTGDRHANMYTLLNVLRGVCDDPDVQQLQLVGVMSGSVDCIVEEMGPPNFPAPWVATLVVDVTLPDGPVDLGGGS
jgi:hypothetical protein